MIDLKDLSLTVVFLPFLDPVSGRLFVNVTSFEIEKISQNRPDSEVDSIIILYGSTILSSMLNYTFVELADTILDNSQSMFNLF